MAPEEPKHLDLSQFSSLDDALAKAEPGDRYLEIGKLALAIEGDERPLTLVVSYWFSMITHSQGLHEAIEREIRFENPHATFPLMRAFFESVLTTIYVLDKPEYVRTLIQRPRELPDGEPRRKSIQALINHAKPHAPGMKDVYAELSEATHVGVIAMWGSVVPEGENADGGGNTSWQSRPRWRDEEQAMIACAQLIELADAMEYFLRIIFEVHVRPLWTDAQQ